MKEWDELKLVQEKIHEALDKGYPPIGKGGFNNPKGAKKIDEIVELMNFDPKGRKGNAKGGRVDDTEVNLTVIKIPDISGSGVETLFERR